MNEIFVTIMLFCVTCVCAVGSITAVVFLTALTQEFLEEQYWKRK
jgi:hypothetical protein